MTNLFEKTKQFVIDAYAKKGKTDFRIMHFERTVYWLLQLKPEADEALQIAAFAHDIERSERDQDNNRYAESDRGFMDPEILKHHQERGGEIMADFLEKQGADKTMCDRVKQLISKHEVGGTDDQNLLKDADSVSFLENNIDFFIEKKLLEVGKEKVKAKLEWMYTRITSLRAKEIAKQWYEDAMKRLEKIH